MPKRKWNAFAPFSKALSHSPWPGSERERERERERKRERERERARERERERGIVSVCEQEFGVELHK